MTSSILTDSLVRDGHQFIGGEWQGADDSTTFPVANPATGDVVAHVPKSGRAETRRAVEAASAALPSWRARTADDRCRTLRRMYELMTEREEGLAALLTAEQGKPLAEARGEIAQAASFFRWYSEEGRRHYGDTIPTDRPDRRLSVIRSAIGVVAAVTPWNFPSSMAARKIAPALAAGCTIVLKPAEDTPLSAFAIALIAEEAGVPAGVLNVVTGTPADIGAEMTSNPLVRKITFTGSTPVGKLLAEQSTSTVKRLSLELGGNAAFCVFDDADLDAAVAGAVASRFRNAGQTCVAANRIFVQAGIHDEFVKRLAAAIDTFVVGAGTSPDATIGPLVNAAAARKVDDLYADAVARGATEVTIAQTVPDQPAFAPPRLLTGVTDDMRLATDEIFGPIASVLKFETEEELVRRANSTPYGLVAYFYTTNRARQVRIAEALDFGMVGINECLVAYEGAPFGGMKESGSGREGSKYGLDDYTEIKYLCEGGLG